jgi:hypothetical protein
MEKVLKTQESTDLAAGKGKEGEMSGVTTCGPHQGRSNPATLGLSHSFASLGKKQKANTIQMLTEHLNCTNT